MRSVPILVFPMLWFEVDQLTLRLLADEQLVRSAREAAWVHFHGLAYLH